MKWLAVCVSVVACLCFYFIRRNRNYVICKTFEDYYWNRDNNPNCYHNPDADFKVPDIVQRNGYPIEQYEIQTEDGYISTLFRIPYGKNSAARKPGKPIYLLHGMVLNSGVFVNTGKKSLGFILADAGYDVWLGNLRGTLYARKHAHLNDKDAEFWNFSFHEFGAYDLPAQLNRINAITKQKIIFVGYSLGSTAGYVYGSMHPKAASDQLDIFINLAPIVYVDNVGLTFKLIGLFWPVFEPILTITRTWRLIPRELFQYEVAKLMCLSFPFQMRLCQIPEMMLLGFSFEQNDPETLPVTLQHNADAVSTKTLTHFYQISRTSEFQHFDYGAENNKKVYGALEPKHYNLSDVKVPSYTILGNNDEAVGKEDVDKLYNMLPKETTSHGIYVVKGNFNHLDFVTGKDVVPLVYDHLLNFLDKL